MARHDKRIDKKVAGPGWDVIREKLMSVHRLLLGVDDSAASQLTTIYVKYKIADDPIAGVFAVMWIRAVKQVVLGLATPDKLADKAIMVAPKGMKYAGLNSYVRITENEEVPSKLREWIRLAWANAKATQE